MINIIVLSVLGIMVSSYLLYVEKRLAKDRNYVPVCDISGNVSCSKATKSSYSHLFGVSNALLGLLFYFVLFILSIFDQVWIMLIITVPALLMTLYLLYLSYFRLKTYCIACTITYTINILLFILIITRL